MTEQTHEEKLAAFEAALRRQEHELNRLKQHLSAWEARLTKVETEVSEFGEAIESIRDHIWPV